MHVKELFDGLLVLLAGVTLWLQLCHVRHPINNISTLLTQCHVKGTSSSGVIRVYGVAKGTKH